MAPVISVMLKNSATVPVTFDAVPVVFERRGDRVTSTIRPVQDPRREVVPAEDAGQTLTSAQKRFRSAWLASQAR